VEHDLIVKTFENHLLKSLCSEASWKQLRVSCGGERIREISTPVFREALKIINSLYYSNFQDMCNDGVMGRGERLSIRTVCITRDPSLYQ